MLKNKKLLFVYPALFIIAAVLIFTAELLSSAFIYADDTEAARLSGFWGNFNPVNGIYTAGVLGNLFEVYIPFKLDMHPSYFRDVYFSIIETFLLAGSAFLFSRLLYRKFDFLFPSVFSAVFGAMLGFICMQPYILFVYEGFFRIFLSIFIWVLFFILFRKYIETGSYKMLIGAAFSAFLSCISGEFSCFITAAGLFIYCLLSVFKKDLKPKEILILAAAVLSGLAAAKYTGTFERKLHLFQSSAQIAAYAADFAFDYFKYVFLKHAAAYAVLITQLIILNLKYKDEKAKNLSIFCLCTIGAVLAFFALLAVLGRTHYQKGMFWLVHNDLHFMYSIVLCSLNFALFNIFIERKAVNNYIIGIFSFLFAAVSIPLSFQYLYKHAETMIMTYRIQTYKAEKIIRTAACLGKTAYLPEVLLLNPSYWALYPYASKPELNTLYKGSSASYINYLNIFQRDNKLELDFMFTNNERADEEFRNNGGKFTQDELKKTNFNSLYYICR